MIFHEISKECYIWLQKQPNVKEESLTDWILYTTSQRTDRFYYKAFTRNQEAHNGADWEWWVLTDGGYGTHAYRFLVQAKKLKNGKDNYPLISYGNRNGLQIDLLIDSAKKRNAMPIYMYYSTEKPEIVQQLKSFDFIDKDIVVWCKSCINGAYMSMAHRVKDEIFGSPRKKISEVDLLNFSLGFSMCDLLFCTKHSPEEIMSSINRYYIRNMGDIVPSSLDGIRHLGKSIPNYLNTLISHNKDFPDWYESEYKYHLDDIAGIAVIDLRER